MADEDRIYFAQPRRRRAGAAPLPATPNVAEAHRKLQRAYLERASVGDRPQDAAAADRLISSWRRRGARKVSSISVSRASSRALLEPRIAARFLFPELVGEAAGADFGQHLGHARADAFVDDPPSAEQRAELGSVGNDLAHAGDPARFDQFGDAASARRRIRDRRPRATRRPRPASRTRRSAARGRRPTPPPAR